jgi:hypothetical protein
VLSVIVPKEYNVVVNDEEKDYYGNSPDMRFDERLTNIRSVKEFEEDLIKKKSFEGCKKREKEKNKEKGRKIIKILKKKNEKIEENKSSNKEVNNRKRFRYNESEIEEEEKNIFLQEEVSDYESMDESIDETGIFLKLTKYNKKRRALQKRHLLLEEKKKK